MFSYPYWQIDCFKFLFLFKTGQNVKKKKKKGYTK